MATCTRLLETAIVLGIGLFITVIIGKAHESFLGQPVMFILLAVICFAAVGSQALYSLAAGKRFPIWCSSGGALLTLLCLCDATVALYSPVGYALQFIMASGMLISCPILSWVAVRSKIHKPDDESSGGKQITA